MSAKRSPEARFCVIFLYYFTSVYVLYSAYIVQLRKIGNTAYFSCISMHNAFSGGGHGWSMMENRGCLDSGRSLCVPCLLIYALRVGVCMHTGHPSSATSGGHKSGILWLDITLCAPHCCVKISYIPSSLHSMELPSGDNSKKIDVIFYTLFFHPEYHLWSGGFVV